MCRFKSVVLVCLVYSVLIVGQSVAQEEMIPIPADEFQESNACGCVDDSQIRFNITEDGFFVEIDLPFPSQAFLQTGLDYSWGSLVVVIVEKFDLEKCIDTVNTNHPEPTKNDGESEEDFQKRLKQWRIDWRNAAEACMKANMPDPPFKPKKNSGEKKAPWTDKGGRKWEPHQDANHGPHWDVTPALPKPQGTSGDTWEQDGCTLTDKGTYTTVYPGWSK